MWLRCQKYSWASATVSLTNAVAQMYVVTIQNTYEQRMCTCAGMRGHIAWCPCVQSTEEQQLADLKVSVDRLEATQTRLEGTVSSFTASVQQANTDAAARAADRTLPQLIERSRLQLAADEAKTQRLLSTIIGNQNLVRAPHLVSSHRKTAVALLSPYEV